MNRKKLDLPEISSSKINRIKEAVLHSVDDTYYKQKEDEERSIALVKLQTKIIEDTLNSMMEQENSLSNSVEDLKKAISLNSKDTSNIQEKEIESYIEKLMKNSNFSK